MEKLKTQDARFKTTTQNLKLYVLRFSFALCALHFTLLILFIQPVYALDSTPSADIRAKLEELKKEIASKAAKLKQEIGRKLRDKAYVGKIQSKSPTSLTLAAASGPKIVSINQDTLFESKVKRKTKLSQKSLAEEDYISALGDTDEVGVLTAKKIILLPPPSETQKIHLWGQIISVSDNLTTLKTNDSKNVAAALPAGSGGGLNDFVILTGKKDKNEVFKAQFVYVIPQGASLKPKKASPSAKTATSSSQSKQATSSGKVKPKKTN